MGSDKEARMQKELGQWIAYLRKDAKLTQKQLAEKLDMTVVAVAYIEGGKRWPRLGTLDKIATTLGYTVADLFHVFNKK